MVIKCWGWGEVGEWGENFTKEYKLPVRGEVLRSNAQHDDYS